MTTGNQQIPENLELEIAKIKAEYDVAGIKLMESYTVNGLKGLLLLNGAAAIAILAFLGDIVTTEYIRWIQGITWAVCRNFLCHWKPRLFFYWMYYYICNC